MSDERVNKNTRVLLVEDDDLLRKALQSLLRITGHEVNAVATVAQAIANLGGHTHVLLDLRLPDGEGAQVLRELRHHKSAARVALTTAAPPDSQRMLDALQFHPDKVFPKPYDFHTIKQWLEENAAGQQANA